jgi:hypothetical protein
MPYPSFRKMRIRLALIVVSLIFLRSAICGCSARSLRLARYLLPRTESLSHERVRGFGPTREMASSSSIRAITIVVV